MITSSLPGCRGTPAGIRLSEGRIEYTEPATGRTTELRDGSRLQIGRVNIVIHASI